MTRNLRTLGIALVAAFAMSVVATSAAQAEVPWDFASDGDFTTLKGSQVGQDVFEVTGGGGRVTCNQATYHGEVNEKVTQTITVKPSYGGCTASPFGSAVIHTNSCGYLFHAETASGGVTEGTVDIECTTPGDEITVTASLFGTNKCTIHIPEQSGLKGITFANGVTGGGVKDVTVTVNIQGEIAYTETDGTGFGSCGNSTLRHDGNYTGEATVTGENSDGEPTDVWVEHT